jgi:transposase
VEAMRLYSNQAVSSLALVELQVDAATRLRPADRAVARQAHHRLSQPEVAELIVAYREQVSVKDLAERFGIHRVTVTALLRRHGVELRRAGLVAEEVPKAASLYSQGWSLARLGSKYGVDPATVWRALRAAGVALRPPWWRS